ncbi:TRAM domain-containing protein [Archaeoglobus sp.]
MKNLRFGKPPVSVGEVRELKIVAMGSGGDGIAKVNGFVVFVPGTKVNDVVKVKVTKVLKKFAFAEVVE